MKKLSKQRHDIIDSFEDFERVMEDYFGILPHDLECFLMEKTTNWEYDDFDNSMTFYFNNAWLMDEFLYRIEEMPALNTLYEFDEVEHLDRKNLTLTIIGKTGGLM